MGITEYGIYGMVTSFLSVVSTLFLFGQATSISMAFFADEKRISRNISKEIQTSFKIISVSSFVFSVFILFCSFILGNKIIAYDLLILIVFSAYFTATQLFAYSIVNSMDLYKIYFIAVFFSSILFFTFVVISPTIKGYLLGISCSSLFSTGFIFYNLFSFNYLKRSNTYIFNTKSLLLMGWVSIPGMFISLLYGFIDKYILNNLMGLQNVAVYSLAAFLSLGAGRVLMNSLIKPSGIIMLKHLQCGDYVESLKVIRKVENFLCILLVVVAFFYHLNAFDFLLYFLPSKYKYSFPLLLLLFVGIILEAMMQIISQILIQKKKLYINVFNSAIFLLVSIILNLVLIPVEYSKGATLTFFICNFMCLIVVFFQVKRIANWVEFPARIIISSLIIFAFSYFVFR